MKIDPVYLILAGTFILLLGGMFHAHGQIQVQQIGNGSNSTQISPIQQLVLVPSWVKSIANWWSVGKLSDGDFINATQFLIQNGIIKVPMITTLQSQVQNLTNQNTVLNAKLLQAQSEISLLQSQNAVSKAPMISASQQITPMQTNNQTNDQTVTNSTESTPYNQRHIPKLDPQRTATEWYEGKISDREFINQIQQLVNNGNLANYVHGTQRFGQAQLNETLLNETDGIIPNILKDQAGFYGSGEITQEQFQNVVVGTLFRLGLLSNPGY